MSEGREALRSEWKRAQQNAACGVADQPVRGKKDASAHPGLRRRKRRNRQPMFPPRSRYFFGGMLPPPAGLGIPAYACWYIIPITAGMNTHIGSRNGLDTR